MTAARSKAQTKVHLVMDAVSVAHNINRMEGTKPPVSAHLVIDLTEWCQQRVQCNDVIDQVTCLVLSCALLFHSPLKKYVQFNIC